jgi:hypothetical protein
MNDGEARDERYDAGDDVIEDREQIEIILFLFHRILLVVISLSSFVRYGFNGLDGVVDPLSSVESDPPVSHLSIVQASGLDNALHDKVSHDKVLHDKVLHDNALHDNVLHDNVLHDNVLHDNALHDNVSHLVT